MSESVPRGNLAGRSLGMFINPTVFVAPFLICEPLKLPRYIQDAANDREPFGARREADMSSPRPL